MVSIAGGWFFLMACEMFVLGKRDFRLPGLGSYLQVAASAGDVPAMIWGLSAMIAIIIVIYLGANVVYLRALGRDGLPASTAVAADVATRIAGPVSRGEPTREGRSPASSSPRSCRTARRPRAAEPA